MRAATKLGHPCAQQRQGHDHPLFRVMTKAKPLPPLEVVEELLVYDPESGDLRWRKSPSNFVKTGELAGYVTKPGSSTKSYIRLRIAGRLVLAHRVIWLLMTRCDPSDWEVDHADGDGLNNKWANLRLASKTQNQYNSAAKKNNRAGYKGVCWSKSEKKFSARISVNGQRLFLGWFANAELAHMAYCKAAAELHGDFARAM